MLEAHCSCGFKSGTLCLGGGMLNFKTYFGVPAYCSKCNTIEVVNYLEKKPFCKKCEGSVTIYNDQSLKESGKDNIEERVFEWNHGNNKFTLYYGNYFCPKCHTYNMKFIDVGFWD